MLRLVLILLFQLKLLILCDTGTEIPKYIFLIWKDKKVYKLKNTYMFIYYNFFQV